MKKSIFKIISTLMFAIMMLLSVTSSNISVSGILAVAGGSTGCYHLYCLGSVPGTCENLTNYNCLLVDGGGITTWKQGGFDCTHTEPC